MKQAKFDTLLIIRGLLALLVVVWHVGVVNANTPALINTPGRTAVWIFFGISGYVISYGFITKRYLLNTSSLKAFYYNRFLRIYPLFFLLSLVTVATEYFANENMLLGFSDIPSQLLMLQFNHEYLASGVFWTLGIEVQFYLVSPLLVLLLLQKTRYEWVINSSVYLFFVVWVGFAFYFLGWSFDGRNLLSNLSHFFIGMIGCKIVLSGKSPRLNNYLLTGSMLLILLLTNYLYRNEIKLYWTVGSLLIDMGILSAIFLHASLEQKIISSKEKLLRLFIFLGVISYGVYAWHPYVVKYIPLVQSNTLFVVLVTIVLAGLSYTLIEKPALRIKKQKLKAG